MKDFPVFTTQYGVASLVLREIPTRGDAYITIQSSIEPEKLLEECIFFCRACGAEKIYGKGEGLDLRYPLHTIIYEMRGESVVEPQLLHSLFPVTEQTVGRWRQIFNDSMKNVDNAAALTYLDEEKIVRSGGAYFIHSQGKLLGIGWMEDVKLLAIAAVEKGAGMKVLNTLMSLVEGASVTLEVASTNLPAIRLYERKGFVNTREKGRWYRLL